MPFAFQSRIYLRLIETFDDVFTFHWKLFLLKTDLINVAQPYNDDEAIRVNSINCGLYVSQIKKSYLINISRKLNLILNRGRLWNLIDIFLIMDKEWFSWNIKKDHPNFGGLEQQHYNTLSTLKQ